MNPSSPGTLYRLLALLLVPVWMLHAWRHGARHGVPGYLRMRTRGFDSHREAQVWVHAASVGEVRAIAPLVQALMRRGEAVVFTSFTATGHASIRELFADSVAAGVIPIDSAGRCRAFLGRHSLKLALIMETELWPELLYQTRRHGVPLLLVNARLSRKSLEANALARRWLAAALANFDRIFARGRGEREALLRLGAQPEQVAIIGNLKSTIPPATTRERLIERDYLLLASSHADEEQWFLEARPRQADTPLLVLAPRHPDRSAALQALLRRLGVSFAVRSLAQPIAADTEVYLADTLGELGALMAHARVVVMGGSFDATGGHNLIEPAALGCAIITGPADSNIAADIDMLGADRGVVQVDDMKSCWAVIETLLAAPARARALGREAQARLARQPDAVQQYLAAIEPFL